MKDLYYLLSLAILSVLPIAANAQCEHPDYAPLMALYNSTNGPNWSHNSGWVDGAAGTNCDPCNAWIGVTCDSISRVSEIKLNTNNLNGMIPEEIGDLRYLTSLSMSNNDLFGNIPSTITALGELSSLVLWGNSLSGSIPEDIGQLHKLSQILLQQNSLSGVIPISIANIDSLAILTLTNNQLSGNIPEELGSLEKLISLNLSLNQLSGEIPSQIGSLSNLNGLYLASNNLTGNIPSELGNLSSLNELSVSNNNLTGSIPASLGDLPLISKLILRENQLSGCYDPNLQNLCNLGGLDFTMNPLLPWEGDFFQYCVTDGAVESQEGAPCNDGDSENGSSDIIIDCECRSAVSTVDQIENYFNVYPNPAQNIMYFSKELMQYELLDIYGRQVQSGVNAVHIEVSQLATGVYVLYAFDGHQSYTRSISIAR